MKKNVLSCFYLLVFILISTYMKAQNNDYIEMIRCAVMAPSGHNTQPWKFRMKEDVIEIIPDFSKTLPVVDGDNRELFISLGCATENLCLAASKFGYRQDVKISDEGIISVYLTKEEGVKYDPLFEQIEKRQTNRKLYDKKFVDENILSACIASLPEVENINIFDWHNGSPEYEVLKNKILEGNFLQMNDEKFVEELKSWMRYNKKQSEEKKDGLSYHIYSAPNLPSFISKPIMSSFLNSKKQNKSDLDKIESSSHFILFTTREDTNRKCIELGRHLQRFLLKLTESGIAHAYMNQPCEVKEIRNTLNTELPINNTLPQILLRIGYAEKAPYSKRKNIEEVILE